MQRPPITIIVTKLYPPVSLAATVPRQRLLDRLQQQQLRKLTLLQSPAGFGKSTLLAQWRKLMPGVSAWLSLDRDDAEPARFLSYLIAALQTTGQLSGEDARRCLDGSGQLASHDVVGCLINEIVEVQQPLVLFLDDYHLVDCDDIGAIIQDLINFSPANFHLVVASRTSPSLPVASLRAANALTEFDDTDMRFDRQEATGFFRNLRGLDLSEAEVGDLTDKTEGWIAGLQLATLSLQDADQRQRFIDNFSGDIRDVADYLSAEVLNQQEPAIREFLLKTSILERINADLANTLMDDVNGQQLLEQLEARSLFLVPLDNSRKWYRYHHLFRGFLQARLRRDYADQIAVLAGRASHWFLQEGFIEEAIGYALESNDPRYSADLLETHALRLIYDGRLPQIDRWITKVPAQIYQQSFRLRAYHCWALMHMGRWQQTDAILDGTEQDLQQRQVSSTPLCAQEVELIEAEIRVLRLANAVISDDFDRAERLGVQALPEAQEFSYFAGTQANAVGFLSLVRSELNDALAWGQKALVRHRQSGSVYGQVYAYVVMGLSLIARGDLLEARERMESAEQLVVNELNHHAFGAAMINVIEGAICYELNQLSRARELVGDSLGLVEECAALEIRNLAFITLARIEQAEGHPGVALDYHRRALESYREREIDRTRMQLGSDQLKWQLTALEPATEVQAEQWRQITARAGELGVDLAEPPTPPLNWQQDYFFRALIYSRLQLAAGNADAALAVLPDLQSLTRRAGREMMTLETGLLLAQAHFQLGDVRRAWSCALEVLEASRRQQYQRLFLDEGRRMLPLWKQLHAHLSSEVGSAALSNTLTGLITALETPPASVTQPIDVEPSSSPLQSLGQGLVEALSQRELGVLQLMSKGLSNKQIASELSVSVNTVRWHVSNILSKLGASNRTEAVSRAQQMGLGPGL